MIEKIILDSISNAVVKVPGVVSFANFAAKTQTEIKTDDILKAVELTTADVIDRVKVHIVLINGVNIWNVVNEVQICVKYELEKASQFVRNYIVDIAVDDIIVV